MQEWRGDHFSRHGHSPDGRRDGSTGRKVSAAALTVYDMCKALDKGMEITDIVLLEKIGGKSGHYLREKK